MRGLVLSRHALFAGRSMTVCFTVRLAHSVSVTLPKSGSNIMWIIVKRTWASVVGPVESRTCITQGPAFISTFLKSLEHRLEVYVCVCV
jgi:hypothetical protein